MHSIRFYALKVHCIHVSTSKQMNFKMNVLIKQKKSYLQARNLLMKFYFSNNKPAFCLSWACMCIPSEQLHRAASSLPPTRGQWIVLRLEHGGHTYTASGDAMVTLRPGGGDGDSVETEGTSSWLEWDLVPVEDSDGGDDEAEVWAGVSGGVSRAGLVEAAAGPRCGEDQTRLGEPGQQSAQYTGQG